MTRKKKKKKTSAARKEVTIRMYSVGFGDCFLLRIPTPDGERRMLVDCGFHSQGKGAFSDKEIVEKIKPYTDLGFTELVFHFPGNDQRRYIDEFAADVAPLLRK